MGETGNRFFIHYHFASRVWRSFLFALSLSFVMLDLVRDFFCQWGGGLKGDRGWMFLNALVLCFDGEFVKRGIEGFLKARERRCVK